MYSYIKNVYPTDLHVEPLAETDSMVDMPAPCHLGTSHVLVTDAADIVVLLQLIPRRVLQAVDLCHGRPALAERAPPVFCLAPDVEVGVDEHHDGPDGAATLEEQDPAAVEEEEDGKAELDGVAKSSDVVNTVVK